MQMGSLEHDVGYYTENGQRDALLNDLQLDEIERSSVFHKAQSVGGYLTAIFEKGNHPREGDDTNEWPVAAGSRFLQFQMPIPSQRHKNVA